MTFTKVVHRLAVTLLYLYHLLFCIYCTSLMNGYQRARDVFSCLTESWVTGVDEFDCVVLYFNNATGYLAALHRNPCLGVFTLFADIIFCSISKIQSQQQILSIRTLYNKICNRYNIQANHWLADHKISGTSGRITINLGIQLPLKS